MTVTTASETVAASNGRRPLDEGTSVNARRLTGGFLVLTAGTLVAKVITFAVFTYLARVLGAERYGSLEFVLAMMFAFTLPVDFGLGVYGAREIAKDPRQASGLIREIATLRLLMALAAMLVLVGLVAVLPKPHEVRLLLFFCGLSLLGMPALFDWAFQGFQAMHWVSAITIVRQVAFAFLVFFVVRPGTPLYAVGLIECASVAAAAAFGLAVIHYRLRLPFPRFRFQWPTLAARWRTAAPIGMGQLAWAFLWFLPTVQLGFLTSGDSVARFGAAHRVVMALHTFVWLYFVNLLPTMSQCASVRGRDIRDLLRRSLILVSWGGIFVAFVTGLLSERLLVLAYGPAFSGGGWLLAVLIWLIPIALLSGHYRYGLIAYNLQSLDFLCTTASAVVGAALGFLLIPAMGSLGAVVAIVTANVVNLVLAAYCVQRRITRIRFLPHLAAPLAAMGVSLGVFFLLAADYFWLAAGAAVAVYLAVLIACQHHRMLAISRKFAFASLKGTPILMEPEISSVPESTTTTNNTLIAAPAAPRISVIVPVYNDAAHLRTCVEALTQSSYPNYEIIVVDDGSTDDTPELIRDLPVRSVRLERKSGPAAARNCGAAAALGDCFFFIDADVCVKPHTLSQVVRAFEYEPDMAAVFGSYDATPAAPNFLSQYKNLMHHHIHQEGNHLASTFWSGCGAVLRSVFQEMNGFNARMYARPCIEDIELGVRLRKAGHKIVLDKDIQVTHLKRWSFGSILKADIFDRAIPWSQLICREGKLPNDLNVKRIHRGSAAIAWALLLAFGVACWYEWMLLPFPLAIAAAILFIDGWSSSRRAPALLWLLAAIPMLGLAGAIAWRFGLWAAVPLGLLLGLTLLNWPLLVFFGRRRDWLFAALTLPMLIAYYVYSSGVFTACLLLAVARGVAVFTGRIREAWGAGGDAFSTTSLADANDGGLIPVDSVAPLADAWVPSAIEVPRRKSHDERLAARPKPR